MRDLRLQEMLALGAGLVSGGRFLWKMPYRSLGGIRAWQLERVRWLVAHAYRHVPFYRDLYRSVGFAPEDLKTWDDFHRLPLVTKDQVIENYPGRMLAEDIDRETLIISRSSGSSGKVLDIAYDPGAMRIYVLAALRLYRMGFEYRPWHRQLYIYTSPYPLSSMLGLFPLKFVPTLAPIPEIIGSIVSFRPHLLVCYPSHLRQIAQEISVADRKKIRLKCVSVNSEMSSQQERDELEEFFGCQVLDEYSSEELTRISAQCRHKSYHVFEDVNYMETVDEAGDPVAGTGIIVGTNLHNRAMPMIRYVQDDLGAFREKPCPCGRSFRHLEELQGRRNDSFNLPSGRVLSSGFLLDATYDMLLTYRDAARDFCLIQDDAAHVRLQVVPGVGWSANTERGIVERFRTFFEEEVSFAVEVVEACEKARTGKRNPIISYAGRRALPFAREDSERPAPS